MPRLREYTSEYIHSRPTLESPLGRELFDWYLNNRYAGPEELREKTPETRQLLTKHLEELSEKLHDINEPSDQLPALSIGMLFAERTESLDSLSKSFRQIKKAQRGFGLPVEVVVWSNQHADSDTHSGRKDEIDAFLKNEATDNLQIAIAHDEVPVATEFNIKQMSIIRQRMMDALVMRAKKRDYPIDQPMMWLDADTTFVGKDAFAEVLR